MAHHLVYHPLVHKTDLARIGHDSQRRIMEAIEEKLVTHPEIFGHPLAKNLAGYWKLRVGNYRVIFKAVQNEIWIYAIAHRKDVYARILKRIS